MCQLQNLTANPQDGLATAVVYFSQARGLSNREHEILHLAAHGLADKQIATRLGLAYTTIKCYWKRIYQKLAVPNRQFVLAALMASLAGTSTDAYANADPGAGAESESSSR
jgi:DNA-binding NarL/FixJ family response regulator